MKQKRQLLALLLTVIFILTGCANSRNKLETPSRTEPATTPISQETTTNNSDIPANNTGSKCNYDFSIYDDGRTFTKEQISVQSDFEKFLHDLFIDEMTSSSSISLHFSIEHPENFDMEKPKPNWGEELNYKDTSANEAELKDTLNKLKTFDYDALTYEQQLIYDIFKEYLEDEQDAAGYLLFTSAFAPMSGLQSELPIIFSEYDFLEKADIDDYISLLNTSYSYVKSMCDYELYRMEKGYALSNYSIKKIIDQCNEFINANPNCIRPIFESKLKDFGELTDEEISSYMEQFDKGLNEQLIPGYKLIITTLETIEKSNPSKGGLCNYENGKDFYEYLVKNNSGSDRSVDDLNKLINNKMTEYLDTITGLSMQNPSLLTDMEEYEYFTDDPSEMLDHLIDALEEDFPAATNDKYTINYVPKSLESTMNPAYYLVPPIDNPNRNNIYINNYEEYAHMDLFPTIAHEGFPGHMYQTTYFYSLNPHYIRSLLSFNGYVEGWAKYIELCYSYTYSGMDKNLAKAYECNDAFGFALYCLCDIGINYLGWDYDDTAGFLATYVGSDKDVIEEIYYTMIDEPTVYMRYYVGYLEIDSLKEDAMKDLGSAFDIKEFHRFILEIGPCQFEIIEDRMEDWIDRAMNGK